MDERSIDITVLQVKLARERDLDISALPIKRINELLRRHIKNAGITRMADYLQLLDSDPQEYMSLLQELTALPDGFFGDADLTSLLQDHLIPTMLAGKKPGDRIRIWVAQCGKCYLAYEVAMLLWETLGAKVNDYDLSVIATNYDGKIIENARRQFFTEGQLTKAPRVRNHMERAGSRFRISPEVRRLITFGVHDLVNDPPYPRIDLLLCIGYLPLLETVSRERARSKLVYSLVQGGQMVLSRGEILGLGEQGPGTWRFPVFVKQVAHPTELPTTRTEEPALWGRSLLEIISTPAFVVNATGKIIDTNQAARRALSFHSRLIGHTIGRMQPEEVFMPISRAIDLARSTGRTEIIEGLNEWVGAAALTVSSAGPGVSVVVTLMPCTTCFKKSAQSMEMQAAYTEVTANAAETISNMWAHRLEIAQLRRQASAITDAFYHRTEELTKAREELESRNIELTVAIQELRDTMREREKAEQEVREALDREHRIAQTLQEALLPPVSPQAKEFKIAVKYKAAWEEAEVGGDFYHYAALPDDVSIFLLGDVSGKGLEAAVHSSMAKFMALGYAQETPAPDILLMRLNDALSVYTYNSTFVTLVYMMLDLKTHNIYYGSAGHEPVIYFSHAAGETRLLMPTGRALGIQTQAEYTSEEIPMGHGDIVLVYTDGISDAGSRDNMLGAEGIAEILKEHASGEPQQILDFLFSTATEYAGGRLRDDAAAVIVKRE